jgi:PKD repeat protein
MLAYYFNLQCNNNLIANNTGYYGVFGIYGYSYNSGSYRAEFKQNTVQVDATNSGYAYHYTYGLYLYPYYHTKVNVLGNVVDIQNSYGAYPAYTYNTSGATPYTWDYNNYYLKNISYEYWYCPNGNAGNLSAWQNLGFAGNNETGHQPLYRDISNNDFTIDVFELQNKVPNVTSLFPTNNRYSGSYNMEDVNSSLRNSRSSDHGAIESPMNILAAETGFTIKDTVCAGFKTLGDLTVTNRYVDTIYDFDITLATDDGTKVSKTVTDKILPGDSLKVEFDDMLQLDKVGDLNVMIYVDAANDTLSDDTFYFSTYVKPAPGGSKFVSSTKSTAAVYQYGKPNDVTVIYQPVIYDINAPTKYSNSTYNTDWEAFVQAYTASGRAISGASLSDPATTGGDMEVTFMTGDTTLEDSMVTITVRVLDLNNNCDTFISRDVFIYPSIIPAFSYPSQICEGEAVLFENKSKVLSGSMEFMWDFGTGNAADQTEAPEPVFQFPGSGDYDVTLTTKTVPWGFAFDTTVTITVNPIPTIAFAKTNACEGDELTFTNKTTPSTADMSWDFGDGTSSTSASPKKKYANPGSYVVTLEADLNGCVATMSQKVYQFDRPVADFAVTSGTCDNDVFEFQNNTTMGSGLFGSYWDFDDNGSVSTDVDAMYDFMSSGDKNVSLVVTSEFGCKDTIVKTVSIKESPKVRFTNGPLCSVKPTDFINTTPDVSNTFASYEWNFGDGNTSGAKSPTHNWAGNLGPKKVSLKITLDNGCSEMLEKDLVVLTQPTPNFAAEDVCSGDDVIFVNNTTWAQGEISYVWDFGDGTNSTNSDPVKQYITSVTLTPKVTLYAYIDGGCADSITKEIVINETPRTCDFVAEADYGYGFYGMKVEPVNQSGVVGGQDEVDYVWVFEGGGTKKTSGQDAAAYNDFATDGEYRVTMRATMQQTGCECSITKNVVMNRSNAQELLNDGVSVYPNPASGVFTVATTEVFGKNVTIEVRTMSGQIVKVMENVGTSMVQVDASTMSNGMYLVKVSNGEKEITRKLHIQN